MLFPEFFGGDLVGDLYDISPALRDRLRAWNDIWQDNIDLDQDSRVNNGWRDSALGWQWVAEGERLVDALQTELGPAPQVIGDFLVHAPRDKRPRATP